MSPKHVPKYNNRKDSRFWSSRDIRKEIAMKEWNSSEEGQERKEKEDGTTRQVVQQ